MGPFVAAWLIGEGVIVYRAIRSTHLPPVPGALLASSGLFAGLAVMAESDTLRPLATTLAYAFDLAAFMNLWPAVTSGQGTSSSAKNPPQQSAAGKGGRIVTQGTTQP